MIQDKAQPGDIRFKDLNHDGVLDENDKTWIGNPYPDLMVGLNLGFNYKNFDSQPTSTEHSATISLIKPRIIFRGKRAERMGRYAGKSMAWRRYQQ